MAVPKRRTSSTKRDKRRSHDALTAPNVIECQDCGEATVMHRACPNCGRYRGRQVIQIEE